MKYLYNKLSRYMHARTTRKHNAYRTC